MFCVETHKQNLYIYIYEMSSKWTKFATNYYKEQKKTNPLYQFKDALVDAGKIYKKTVATPIGNAANKVGNTVSQMANPLTRTQRRRRGSRRRVNHRRSKKGYRRGGNDGEVLKTEVVSE